MNISGILVFKKSVLRREAGDDEKWGYERGGAGYR